jgi:hypothetical protein
MKENKTMEKRHRLPIVLWDKYYVVPNEDMSNKLLAFFADNGIPYRIGLHELGTEDDGRLRVNMKVNWNRPEDGEEVSTILSNEEELLSIINDVTHAL